MSLFPLMDNEESKGIKPVSTIETVPIEYEYDFDKHTLTGRFVKGNEALKIWIIKVLKTKRYKHVIYSWDYGIELEELISLNYERAFIESEIARDIEEALKVNPHVKGITQFTTIFEQDHLICDFTVITDYGEVKVNEKYANL